MKKNISNIYKSHGNGKFLKKNFLEIGKNVVFEKGALVFHPENIKIGNNVYVGHYAILKSYFNGSINIGDNSWIGQKVFIHGGGNINIGKYVGIGPGVNIISSFHDYNDSKYIIKNKIIFKKVNIGNGTDIGVSSTILPGVSIGQNCMIGAGSLVNKNIPSGYLAVGNPIKLIRKIK